MVDISSNSPVASPRNRPFTSTRNRIPTAPPVEGETNVKGTPERVPAPPIEGETNVNNISAPSPAEDVPAPPVEGETNVKDIPAPTDDYDTEMAGRPSSVPAPDTPLSRRVSTGIPTIDMVGEALSDIGRGMVDRKSVV